MLIRRLGTWGLLLALLTAPALAGFKFAPPPNLSGHPAKTPLFLLPPRPYGLDPAEWISISAAPAPPKSGEKEPQTLTLLAVGDILFHDTCIRSGYDTTTATYDFSPIFEQVAPLFHDADFVIGNMEGKLADPDIKVGIWEYKDYGGFTGYPLFNAPPQLATDLVEAGFTAVTTANNHAMDRLAAGVFSTNRHLDKAGLTHAGCYTSQRDRDSIRVLEAEGVRVAFLACTYGTNGILPDSSQPWLVNMIDLDVIRADVQRACELNVDLVALAIHWGREYEREPTLQQRRMADSLFAMGVDIILGSHPHVVQPFDLRYEETPEGGRRITNVVIYSLGNFISNQGDEFTNEGVIFQVELERQPDGEVEIAWVTPHPTFVQRWREKGEPRFRILPLKQFLESPAPLTPAPDVGALLSMYERALKHTCSLVEK